MRPALTLTAIAMSATVLAACGSSDSGVVSTPTSAGGDDAAAQPSGAGTGQDTSSAPSGCKVAQQPKAQNAKKRSRPKQSLAKGKTYTVVLQTNCGEIDVKLDQSKWPKTAASVASLAKSNYYGGTVFTRVLSGQIIQGGDPTNTGAGPGPGYQVVEKPPTSTAYRQGVFAMAKTGQAPSGASGDAFFIVTGPDGGFPPDYAVAGRVSKGLDVAKRINSVPTSTDPNSGEQSVPQTPMVIEKSSLKVG